MMQHHPHHSPNQHRVTALFGDHEQSFDLKNGTTLEQLVERLADLARQNHGWPLGISVVFDTPAVSNREADLRHCNSAAQVRQVR